METTDHKISGYNLSDFFFKLFDRIMDHSIRLGWKLVIGKIGKGSFIKKGLIVKGSPRRIKIGNNFKIWEQCFISVRYGLIEIGNNGLIGARTYINCSTNRLTIGNNVAIAPNCQFFTYSHHYSLDKTVDQSHIFGDIIIEDNVLIGAGSIVLPNVNIGKNAVVAAGSVVTKNVAPNTIVGGIPAKVIRKNEYHLNS